MYMLELVLLRNLFIIVGFILKTLRIRFFFLRAQFSQINFYTFAFLGGGGKLALEDIVKSRKRVFKVPPIIFL